MREGETVDDLFNRVYNYAERRLIQKVDETEQELRGVTGKKGK